MAGEVARQNEQGAATSGLTAGSIIGHIQNVAEAYKRIGFAECTASVGVVIIVFTFFVEINISSDDGSSYLGIDFGETILFLISGLVILIIGAMMLTVRNIFQNKLEILRLNFEIAQFAHVERMAEVARQIGQAQGPRPEMPKAF